MRCQNCGEPKLEADPIRGLIYCSKCGVVQEENAIVSSLDFSEEKGATKLTGQIIQITETFTKVGKSFIQTSSFYIENKINNICSGLGLGHEHASAAFRWYKLALQYNVSKGKNILYTLSACIYIVCRQERTPHMLIDFSALLRIDVNKIGKVFLKIVNFLGVRTALTDPSFYLPRFIAKLGIQNPRVLETSMRIVGRMKRDWIVVGRRPNNLCGAALLVSCRIFNEERSIDDIARVVNVSKLTINKRLRELCDTESAGLSVKEFFKVWLDKEEEPPIMKKRRFSGEIERLFGKSERGALASSEQTGEDEKLCACGSKACKGCSFSRADEAQGLSEKENRGMESVPEPCSVQKKSKSYRSRKLRSRIVLHRGTGFEQASDDDCADIDDREIDSLILSRDETEKREKVWNEMYGEYMRWKETKVAVERNRRRRRRQPKRFGSFTEAIENCIREKNLSKKINFEAVRKLFD